jgi:hypothetical protein
MDRRSSSAQTRHLNYQEDTRHTSADLKFSQMSWSGFRNRSKGEEFLTQTFRVWPFSSSASGGIFGDSTDVVLAFLLAH